MNFSRSKICPVIIVFACWLVSLSTITSAQTETLRINEFMALNQTTLMDEDNEYSDWIEIYNPTSGSVNLYGWTLTDDITLFHQWMFPAVTLNAGEYLVVFASGKDRAKAGSELHTDFRLSGDGEYLALLNTKGVIVSEFRPAFPEQRTDISYGWIENIYAGLNDPTPGAANTQSTAAILPPPVFNKKHGFYDLPFDLTLSCDVAEADIYYTTDGSIPKMGNGTLYTAPLHIQTTSIIRAVALLDDQAVSQVGTQTYLFLDDVIHQPNNPSGYPVEWGPYTAIAGNAIADYEMDPELIADPAFATRVKEALKDIPTISLVSDKGSFFSHDIDPVTGGIYIYTGAPGDETGLGWERPASVEFFNSKDSIDFQVNCGVRLQGGHSRRPEKNPKHSFMLVFKSEYGPSRLNYPLLGEGFAQSFNNLILRAGFGLTWLHWTSGERAMGQLQRDIWTKDAQRAMGHPASNSIFAHLYINGIYWGVYLPSERMDADYAVSYLGGGETEYDVIKDYMESEQDNPAVDGNTQAWDAMIGMVNAGMSSNEAYQAIQGNNADGTHSTEHEAMIDMVNFADYMLLNYYGSNTDWDHHNWAAIRSRVNPGKGFKILSWDAEHMIKTVNGNVLSLNNDYCPSRIFQKMRENDDFLRLFANRVVKHCYNGGVLTPEGTDQLWSVRRNQVEKSMDAEAARWGDYRRDVHPYASGPYELYTRETHWIPAQDFLTDTYFPSRTSVFISQLRSEGLFPQVDPPDFQINGSSFTQQTIKAGDGLTMTAAQGTIYYTTDGTDPVIWRSSQGSSENMLITESATKRVLVPKADIGSTWLSDIGYDDTAWEICSGSPGGVGYENETGYESFITLDVKNDMVTGGTNPNTSCYIRIPFQVSTDNLQQFGSLILSVLYDDGFVVWLNGKKVASALDPATPVWNSAATAGHEAGSFQSFNISDYLGDLKAGENLLAIQGLNANTTSSDFIINVNLSASNQPPASTISENAVPYSGQITLNESANIKARAFYNNEWSALNNRLFLIPDDLYDIRITEIHYHPLPEGVIDDSEFEFIELKNTGTSTLDLGGLSFVDGINYQFASETALGPDEFIVLAANNENFFNRYGFMPFDEFGGQLANNGEWIILTDADRDTLCSLRFNDGSDWPETPDGIGYSLVPKDINPGPDQNNAAYWRASYLKGGSPGRDDLFTESITVQLPDRQKAILSQNYPNPFTDVTYIDYQLYDHAHVKLSVYNILGQEITSLVNQTQPEGLYQVEWNATDRSGKSVANGIYFCRIEIITNDQVEVITKKMLLVR